MKTFGGKVLYFINHLTYNRTPLSKKVTVYNPFKDLPQPTRIATGFYEKYFNDTHPRCTLFGINPFKWGAGLTGIPFTDYKRLQSECHIPYEGKASHENSSLFIYEMIRAFGGVEKFYRHFYFCWLCPVGFLDPSVPNDKGASFYASRELMTIATPLIVENIRRQISIGIRTDICFVIGAGQNDKALRQINDQHHFFKEIITLEHPGYIVRYHNNERSAYIDRYLQALEKAQK
jgi:hypothetical protein